MKTTDSELILPDVALSDEAAVAKHVKTFFLFLEAAKFKKLVALTHGATENPAAVYDMLMPFLTHRLPIAWNQLTLVSQSHQEVSRLLRAATAAVEVCAAWHGERIVWLIGDLAARHDTHPETVERLLRICVLFSEQRLDLVTSLSQLGRDRCVQRLAYAAQQYELFQMVK
jgi:hypothetical protein